MKRFLEASTAFLSMWEKQTSARGHEIYPGKKSSCGRCGSQTDACTCRYGSSDLLYQWTRLHAENAASLMKMGAETWRTLYGQGAAGNPFGYGSKTCSCCENRSGSSCGDTAGTNPKVEEVKWTSTGNFHPTWGIPVKNRTAYPQEVTVKLADWIGKETNQRVAFPHTIEGSTKLGSFEHGEIDVSCDLSGDLVPDVYEGKIDVYVGNVHSVVRKMALDLTASSV